MGESSYYLVESELVNGKTRRRVVRGMKGVYSSIIQRRMRPENRVVRVYSLDGLGDPEMVVEIGEEHAGE